MFSLPLAGSLFSRQFLEVFSFSRGAPLRFHLGFLEDSTRHSGQQTEVDLHQQSGRQPPFLVTQRGKHGWEQDRRVLGILLSRRLRRGDAFVALRVRRWWIGFYELARLTGNFLFLHRPRGGGFGLLLDVGFAEALDGRTDSVRCDLRRRFGLNLEPTLRLLHHRRLVWLFRLLLAHLRSQPLLTSSIALSGRLLTSPVLPLLVWPKVSPSRVF